MQFKTVLIALSAVLLIIGIHQSFFYGFFQSYWLFMGSGLFFLWYQFRKGREERRQNQHHHKKSSPKKTKKRRRAKKR